MAVPGAIEASPGDVIICFHTWQLKLVGITWPVRRFAVCSFDDNEAYWRDICDVSAPDTNSSTRWDMWTCSSAEEFLFPVGKLRKPTRSPSWRNRTAASAADTSGWGAVLCSFMAFGNIVHNPFQILWSPQCLIHKQHQGPESGRLTKPRGITTDFEGGSVHRRRQCDHWPPTSIKPKNRKSHRIWAASFSNLVDTSPPDFKSGGYKYPPSLGGNAPDKPP